MKRTGRDADHLPPSDVQVRNGWSYTSLYPVYIHEVNRGKFIHPCTIFRNIFPCTGVDTVAGSVGMDLVGIDTRLNAGNPRDLISIRGGKKIYFLLSS